MLWRRLRISNTIISIVLGLSIVTNIWSQENSECSKSLWTSPFCTKASYILYPGVALSLGLWAYQDKYYSQKARDYARNRTPSRDLFRYGGKLGNGYLNAGYIVGQLAMGNSSNSMMMFHASLLSSIITLVLKESVQEGRPKDSNIRVSFPSGHTSLAFAFATVVALQHEWYWGALAVTTASYIAYSRMVDDEHWAHDVVAGASIGVAAAIGTKLVHEYYRKDLTWYLIPSNDGKGAAVAKVWDF